MYMSKFVFQQNQASAFTRTATHPAFMSSAPTTLNAQMPREFVRAEPFDRSRQVQSLDNGAPLEIYNQYQDKIEEMGFKPIGGKGLSNPQDADEYTRLLHKLEIFIARYNWLVRRLPTTRNTLPIEIELAKIQDKIRQIQQTLGMAGTGFFDFLDPNKNGVAKAFDPNRNGIAKAFDPNRNGVAKAFDPNRNGIKSGIEKVIRDTGAEKFVTKTLPSTLIHNVLPGAAEFVGSKFGVGKQARQLGEMGANELGKVSGLGLKKGSPEMKAHMAKLRSMRKKKISGGTASSGGFFGNHGEVKPSSSSFIPPEESRKRIDAMNEDIAKQMGATPEQIAKYKSGRKKR